MEQKEAGEERCWVYIFLSDMILNFVYDRTMEMLVHCRSRENSNSWIHAFRPGEATIKFLK